MFLKCHLEHFATQLLTLCNTVKLRYNGLGYNGHLVNTDFWSRLRLHLFQTPVTPLVWTFVYYRPVSWSQHYGECWIQQTNCGQCCAPWFILSVFVLNCCCCQFYSRVFRIFPLDANSYYTSFVDVLSSCVLCKFLFIQSACCLCCVVQRSLLVSLVASISL